MRTLRPFSLTYIDSIIGTRARQVAGTTVDDYMADPDYIAEPICNCIASIVDLAFEIVLRPWVEKW